MITILILVVAFLVTLYLAFNLLPYILWKPKVQSDEEMSTILKDVIQETKEPSVAAALIWKDEVVAINTEGVIIIEGEEMVNHDGLYHWGSTTKSLTAMLITMYIEEGKLSYNSKLGDVLPEIEMRKEYEDVTIKNLLLSNAGLIPLQSTDSEDELLVQNLWETIPEKHKEPIAQRKAMAEIVLNIPPQYEIGSKSVYSNVGWAILGLIVDEISESSYEEEVNKKVFSEIGINNYKIGGWPASSNDPEQPRGHYLLEDGSLNPQEIEDDYKLPLWMNSSGGISTDIEGLALYTKEHLKGLKGNSILLTKDGFDQLHTVHKTEMYSNFYESEIYANSEAEISIGYGWIIENFQGDRISTADGSGGTFFSRIVIYPNLDVGFAGFSNSGNGDKSLARVVEEVSGFKWE